MAQSHSTCPKLVLARLNYKSEYLPDSYSYCVGKKRFILTQVLPLPKLKMFFRNHILKSFSMHMLKIVLKLDVHEDMIC